MNAGYLSLRRCRRGEPTQNWQAMYSITVDYTHRLIRAHLTGFWRVDDVHAFARDEQAAAARAGWQSHDFCLLIDTVGDVIQNQDVMAAFQAMVVNAPRKARRLAIVRQGALARLQTQRIARRRENARVFGTLDDAERWLAGPDSLSPSLSAGLRRA